MTRDNKYLLAADLGTDHVVVYKLNHELGKLTQVDTIYSDQKSGPSHIKISKDGNYIYIIHELGACIDVYEYTNENNTSNFEKIQTISTVNNYHAGGSAGAALNISEDFKFLVASNIGDNSTALFEIDKKNGELTKLFCLPISGDYPKDTCLFPDNKHLVSVNHESNTLTFFSVDPKNKTLIMNAKEIKIEQPNCIIFHKLDEE